MAYELRRAKVLILLSVQSVSKISNLCDHKSQSTNGTNVIDRQTDGRTPSDLTTALCTIVISASRGKNDIENDK